jgi:hypothetical protein
MCRLLVLFCLLLCGCTVWQGMIDDPNMIPVMQQLTTSTIGGSSVFSPVVSAVSGSVWAIFWVGFYIYKKRKGGKNI